MTLFVNGDIVRLTEEGRQMLRPNDTEMAVLSYVDIHGHAWLDRSLTDQKLPSIHSSWIERVPNTINWNRPIFSRGRAMDLVEANFQFRSYAFVDDPDQARWYYNNDGTPFDKNPHPISNDARHDPDKQAEEERQAQLQEEARREEAMAPLEALYQW